MSDEITIPAPPVTWARIESGRVAEVITLPDGEQPSEPGDWQDCTDVQPQPVVGMAYADGVYSLPRWAQIVGDRVMTVVEQIDSPGDGWRDCTGEHVGPGMLSQEGGGYSTPPPDRCHITKRAFQSRFPVTANGVSNKWDLMNFFLNSEAYATSIVADAPTRLALQLLVSTGINRFKDSPFIDLLMGAGGAGEFIGMLQMEMIPSEFRLTAPEAAVVMSLEIEPKEVYTLGDV